MEENKKVTLDDLIGKQPETQSVPVANLDSVTFEPLPNANPNDVSVEPIPNAVPENSGTMPLSAADRAKQNAEAYRQKKMKQNMEFVEELKSEQAKVVAAEQEEHMQRVITGDDQPLNDKEYFGGIFANFQNTLERKKMEKEIIDQAKEEDAEDDVTYSSDIITDGLDTDGDDFDDDEDDDEVVYKISADDSAMGKSSEKVSDTTVEVEDDLKSLKTPEKSLKDALDELDDEDDDDEDEDDGEDVITDVDGNVISRKTYNTQDEMFDALGKAAKDKMKLIDDNKVIDLSQFTVATNAVSLKTAIRVTSVEETPNVSNWALFNTKLPITISEFKGQELAKLTGGEDQNRYTRNREIMKLIYSHDTSESKPESFTDWLKQISVRDNDHLYMAIYKACYSGSNYIPYNCEHCGEVFVTENLDISEMVKYGSEEDEKKAKAIINSALREPEPLKVVRKQISERYVIDFKDPSLYNYFIENAVLSDSFVQNNRDLITYMSYIDNIYVIDYAHRTFIPINLVKYDKDIAKEINSKVKRYSKILKELTDAELGSIEAAIQELLDDTINVSYVLPEQTCPRCGHKIEEQPAQAQDLVFTRHQLGRLATT